MNLPYQSRIAFVVGILILLASAAANGQVRKLYPVDEAATDPSFFVFRARLLAAIQRKDVSFLSSILDPGIQISFGDNGGVAEFKRVWHPERANSQLWPVLLATLSLGGSFDKEHTFSAPYLFNSFPEDLDAFEHYAIIDDGVRVRKAPTTRAPVLRTLSFDIVKVVGEEAKKSVGDNREWLKIELNDGQTGYVAREFIRSPIDYRAIFERKNGKWLMTAFVSGD